MFKNYFIVTVRNLFRNGFYSFINIAGLAIGITCSVLILLWVADERSFDRFLPKVDRLYQVWVNAKFDGKIQSWTSVPLPTYEAMKTADSNIKRTVVTVQSELGYNQENLIATDFNNEVQKNYKVIKQELLRSGVVEAVTRSNSEITNISSNNFLGWPWQARRPARDFYHGGDLHHSNRDFVVDISTHGYVVAGFCDCHR
jgi:hypothetical protein